MDANLISHSRADGSFMNGSRVAELEQRLGQSEGWDIPRTRMDLHNARLDMTAMTSNQNLITWHNARPEHVRPLAMRFTAREIALDGGNLMMRKAVDTLTGASWGRVNMHADGSFECYAVTDPPPEAVPAYKVGPVSAPEVEPVEAEPIAVPEPVVRKPSRK
jgi:hypothetical protein